MKYEEPAIQIMTFDCSDVVCLSIGEGPDLEGEDWEAGMNI